MVVTKINHSLANNNLILDISLISVTSTDLKITLFDLEAG